LRLRSGDTQTPRLAGRTYEEQVEFEEKNGSCMKDGGGGSAARPAAAAVAAISRLLSYRRTILKSSLPALSAAAARSDGAGSGRS